MSTKRRKLFLYLAIACFVGIVAIFVFDGYIGVYDTVYVTAGELEQKIEPEYWLREDGVWSTGTNWGEKVFFRYEVDNRQFSTYSADIEVSVWHSQEKLRDLISQQILVAAFDKGSIEWVMDTTELLPSGIPPIPPEQSYPYTCTVIIKRGEIERKIIVYINPLAYPAKPVPPPVPLR